jgi:hypothetical protein
MDGMVMKGKAPGKNSRLADFGRQKATKIF